jgi:DNA-binding FadR family transcriptional regulator
MKLESGTIAIIRDGTAAAQPRRVAVSKIARSQATFRPIRGVRAFEEIASQIRRELTERRLRPGDRLPAERLLAAQFGVSRNTLREALRSLENSGLLRLRKGATGGAFVNESNGDAVVTGLHDMFRLGSIQPEELTEARVLIESIAVRMACERATAEDIAALKENIAEAERGVRERVDFYDLAAVHLQFHRILALATHNPVMVIVMQALTDVMQHFIRTIGQSRAAWVLPARRRFIRQLEAGDVDAAVAEMKQQLERLNRHYLSLIRQRDQDRAASG